MVPGVYVKASAVSSTENYTASPFYPKTDAFLNSSVSKSAKVLVLDSLQSIKGQDIQTGKTYLRTMEHNLQVLKTALA